jgi:hypothetical protein
MSWNLFIDHPVGGGLDEGYNMTCGAEYSVSNIHYYVIHHSTNSSAQTQYLKKFLLNKKNQSACNLGRCPGSCKRTASWNNTYGRNKFNSMHKARKLHIPY